MRILSNAPDPRFGGPLKRSLAVARELRSHDIETVFLVPEGDDSFSTRAKEEGFDCHRITQPRIRSPRRVRENLQFFFGFNRCVQAAKEVIDAKKIDVTHVNGPLNYAVALAAYRSESSLVWHFNDTLTPTPLKEISATLAERWADCTIVAADAVGEYFFDSKVNTETVYAPVNLDRFDPRETDDRSPQLQKEFGIDKNRDIIGTIGNINPAKGHEYLIEAFNHLNHDAHLVIVGQKLDSQRSYYERLQQKVRALDIEQRVSFTGWRDDIPELLNTFDLFVLPSTTEACPIVVLEAMAMGCPVVATNVGGVTEQIPSDDYGWVVPAENSNALTTAMEMALSDKKDRLERASNARTRVEDVFSLESCVDKHVRIYQSVAHNSMP